MQFNLQSKTNIFLPTPSSSCVVQVNSFIQQIYCFPSKPQWNTIHIYMVLQLSTNVVAALFQISCSPKLAQSISEYKPHIIILLLPYLSVVFVFSEHIYLYKCIDVYYEFHSLIVYFSRRFRACRSHRPGQSVKWLSNPRERFLYIVN